MRKIYRVMSLLMAIALATLPGYSVAGADNETYTISGSITTNEGTPLSNIAVFAQNIGMSGTNPVTCTDFNGSYSLIVRPGLYRLNPQGSSYGPSNPCENPYAPQLNSRAPTDGISITGTSHLYQEVDASSSNVVRNFQIPTVKLTIIALNTHGEPLVNRDAYAQYSTVYESALVDGGSDTVPVGTSFLFSHKTNVDGLVSGYILKGGVFLPGTICVNAYPQPTICNTSTITANEDTVYTLQPGLSAPSNLSAASPTRSPALSWSSVSDAQSYSIYRNNVKIGSSTTNSYTDASAPDGDNVYYVTAANASESVPSNNITVLVDRTVPTIGYSLNSVANAAGWSNKSVIVSFTCSDSLSGIQTCSLPTTVNTEGVNQVVTGSAIDNAGNSASTIAKVTIDKTAPTISSPSMSNTSFVSSSSEVLSANASDALSGVVGGEYYIDTDPGVGLGSAMTYSNGKLTATTTISGLSAGQHALYMRSKDAAGNWSAVSSVSFTNQPVAPVQSPLQALFNAFISFVLLLIKLLLAFLSLFK